MRFDSVGVTANRRAPGKSPRH